MEIRNWENETNYILLYGKGTERVCDKLPLDTEPITVRRIENGVLIESIAIMERNIIEEPKKKGLG